MSAGSKSCKEIRIKTNALDNIKERLACESSPVALGLDFGLNCGYAYAIKRKDGWYISPDYIGVLDLRTGRYDSGNLVFLRLRRFLDVVKPSVVFYEDVKFTPDRSLSSAQALARAATSLELLASLRQTVVLWCEDHSVYCTGIPIGTIKKEATGKGNANKAQVVMACNKRFGTNFDPENLETNGHDNAADAAFVLACGLTEYGDSI